MTDFTEGLFLNHHCRACGKVGLILANTGERRYHNNIDLKCFSWYVQVAQKERDSFWMRRKWKEFVIHATMGANLLVKLYT